jgi:polyisoprenyl-teichoic acid--peptidoglycan teichoic acid transferase
MSRHRGVDTYAGSPQTTRMQPHSRECALVARHADAAEKGSAVSTPSGDKPYRKYRAARLRTPHARVSRGATAQATDPDPAVPSKRDDSRASSGNGTKRAASLGAPAVTVYDAHDAAASGLAGEPKPRRRFRWRYVAFAILALVTVALVIAGVIVHRGYDEFDAAVKRSNRHIDQATRRALTPDAGWIVRNPTTILVLGSDARGNEPSRSDTIMLMRFDPKDHTVTQLSIPRDTLADVQGHGETKINEAYFWGQAPLAIATVERFTGVEINHIMIVRFRGFRRLINGIGGITVNVPETVTSEYIGGRVVTFKKGKRVMNGDEALVYSRIRKSDDDFHRMSRQQQVVQALQTQVARPGNLLDLPTIGSDFMRGVATDLTTNELLALGYLEWRTKPKNVHKYVLEGTPQMIGGGSYVVVDPEVKQRMVRRFLGG